MKNIITAFIAMAAFFLFSLSPVSPLGAQENGEGQKEVQETEDISEEDEKIVENIELLENLDLFMEGDIEMIINLELFLANP